MRVLDIDTDMAVRRITVYLKVEEAKDLYDCIGTMLEQKDFNNHAHVSDTSYDHEITLVLYNDQHIESLNERSRIIIQEDV